MVAFTFEKDYGRLNNLIGWNKRNAKSLRRVFGIVEGKHIVSTYTVELFYFYGVNGRKDESYK